MRIYGNHCGICGLSGKIAQGYGITMSGDITKEYGYRDAKDITRMIEEVGCPAREKAVDTATHKLQMKPWKVQRRFGTVSASCTC